MLKQYLEERLKELHREYLDITSCFNNTEQGAILFRINSAQVDEVKRILEVLESRGQNENR